MKGRDEKYQKNGSIVEIKTTRAEKMRQLRMIKFTDRFVFNKNINDIKVFVEYKDKNLSILHKHCNRSYSATLNDFYKVNSSMINVFSKYVQDKKDLNCPHCLQDAKNKYLKEIINLKFKGNFEINGNYIDKNSDITLLHKTCSQESKFKVLSIIENKELKCLYCSKLLDNNDKRRQKKLIKLKDDFIFSVDVEDDYIFNQYQNEIVPITHKECNRGFEIQLSKLNDINIGMHKYLKEFLKNDLAAKCPHCLQDAKNKYFQCILDSLRKDEFLLVGNYYSIKQDVKVLHKYCGNEFDLNSETIVSKKRLKCSICDCKNRISDVEQINKNKSFNDEMMKMGILDFKCIGNYINKTTETIFLHNLCGYEFKDTPRNFLRRTNKCPKCGDYKKRAFKSQKEKNEYFQEDLDKNVVGFKLVGNYIRRNKDVTLYHNDCQKEFTMIYDYFVNSEYKCPHCQTKKYKYNPSLTIKEKIKYFEEEIGKDYKILSGFTSVSDEVKFRHLSCGREFNKKIFLAIKRNKNSILCPYCELEKRKKAFEKKLKERFDDKYILNGGYINADTETLFRHTKCMKVFKTTPNKILERKYESCPHCNIAEKERENKFKKKLYSKYKSEYALIGDYLGYDKKSLFKHRKCGNLFSEKPIFLFKKEIPCKKCALQKRILPKKEVLKRIVKYNGDMYKMCGEYMGTEKEVPFICTKCKGVFDCKPHRMFRKKVCPHCGEKHM